MFIQRLTMENFHGFEDKTIDFTDRFTVLIGENASGKTAVLDAAAVAIGAFIRGITGSDKNGRTIQESEMFLRPKTLGNSLQLEPQTPTSVYAEGTLETCLFTWKRSMERSGGKTTRISAKEMIQYAESLSKFVQNGKEVNLPVISYFGTGRVLARKRDKTLSPWKVGSRLNGYMDCLDMLSSEKLFTSWMQYMTFISLQEGTEPTELSAVKKAVSQMLSSVLDTENEVSVEYNVKRQAIVMRNGEKMLPFDLLSDGYRNMIGMVADIAFRMAILNPHLGRYVIEQTEGIVLIDEIDLHLHPKWQKVVVNDLKKTFPKVQFITTTHSPFIVQSCEAGELINLNDHHRNVVDFIGWTLEEIAVEEMDVKEFRHPIYEKLMDSFNRSIELEDVERATAAYNELLKILHPNSDQRTILQMDLASISDDFIESSDFL